MENKTILQVGVKVLLKNDKGQYLLLRRSLNKYPEIKGLWDIVGGRINPGQPLLENLHREVREETDMELTGQPKLIAAQDILHDDHHVIRLTYLGEARGDVKLDTTENDMYKWYTREELLNLEDLDIYFRELIKNISIWDAERY